MTQQNGTPKQRSKFPQYIAPIIILLLAIGAAVYGVLWANSDDDASAPTEETAQNDQTEQTQASTHLDDVQREFPDEDAAHQEALAVARGEMETYIHSEASLEMLLVDPEYGHDFDQAAADFAVEHVDVDWNEEASQFAMVFMEQYPETQPDELEELMQDDPQGPQYSAEQTEYALSQLN